MALRSPGKQPHAPETWFRVVVTADGAPQTYGPYSTEEQAHRMGRSYARQALGCDDAVSVSYRVQRAEWVDVSEEITEVASR